MAEKGLGIAQGTAMTIGAVLGTGVLSLPVMAARVAGPASLVAWAALICISVTLAGTFAALGARFPDAGGAATFAGLAFGRPVGAAVGWCFFAAIPIGAPAAAGFGAAYVQDVVGGGWPVRFAATIGQIAVVVALNWIGIHISGRLQLAIAGTLGVLLAVAAAVSLPHARLANLTPFAPYGWTSVAAAAAMLVWAFAGWEAVASLTGEYADPAREVPRVNAIALLTISVLYLAVAGATVSVLGTGASDAPLSDLLEFGFGPAARPVTALVALLLSIGTMNAYFASASRLGAALGRDRLLPAWLGDLSGPRRVPRNSLTVVMVMTALALAIIPLAGLPSDSGLLLVTGCFTLVYVVATAAAVRLLPHRSWGRRSAVIALAASIVLAISSGWHLVPALAVALAAILIIGRQRPVVVRDPEPQASGQGT